MAIEEPKFALVLKDGDFELRDYAPAVVAEVAVNGDQRTAGNKGFRLLAGYIFGDNARTQRIVMTAPVTKVPKGETIAMTAPVFSDEVGQKHGGPDKRCLLEVRTAHHRPVALGYTSETIEQALSGATKEMQRLLESTLGRPHNHDGAGRAGAKKGL